LKISKMVAIICRNPYDNIISPKYPSPKSDRKYPFLAI
jgi:hypothetical protein